jgi:hypothetical protein
MDSRDRFKLGFQKQGVFSNMFSCGAFSTGHALNLSGMTSEIKPLKKRLKTGSHIFDFGKGYGTSEEFIIRHLKKFGKVREISVYSPIDFKKSITASLKKYYPLIINVDDTDHWMVLAGKIKDKYIIVDSGDSFKKPIIYRLSEQQLLKRMKCDCENCEGEKVEYCEKCEGTGYCSNCDGTGEMSYGECRSCKGSGECNNCSGYGWFECSCDGTGKQYYAIEFRPDRTRLTINAIVRLPNYIEYLEKDNNLQLWWGYYLNILKRYFKFGTETKRKQVELVNLMDTYEKDLLNFYSEKGVDEEILLDEFYNIKIVAFAYGFIVNGNSDKEIEKALVKLMKIITKSIQDN